MNAKAPERSDLLGAEGQNEVGDRKGNLKWRYALPALASLKNDHCNSLDTEVGILIAITGLGLTPPAGDTYHHLSSHQNLSSMRIFDENWTDLGKKFGNPMPDVLHLAYSVMKLKYDPEEEERCSLTTRGEGGDGWESVRGGGPVLKAEE
ncbi:hypothetical protein AVEN_131917-1 [Araneus ventricosus]|uniref:Uncharacterized protein n=1 Tax=Araneus ventricosus TaxID=182803 RepID=A0A4Y2MH94_ARAVE|nr:hypothetical protein AVEN_131917-1 [Araneus ventricosus]